QMVSGTGKFERTGLGSRKEVREAANTAFRYFTSNHKSISASISTKTKDYLMHATDLQGIGMTTELALAEFIGICSAAMEKPALESLAILGNITVSGTISKISDFANAIQVCVDAGAKRVLIPAASVNDLQTIPAELLVKVQPIFYSDAIDAVFKALGAV
ncbi:MAG: ATP-dependent Lon protease, partial [Clostridiaceae bacterium]|nr:ATP-dependent Lon protease [Clostridiaceae bacterium]